MSRKRMTDQSVVNVKAAVSATLHDVGDGYVVSLEGSTGKTVNVKDGNGDLVYPSKAAANRALNAHNPSLSASLKPEI